ncbi:MAG: LL-diaminopimelate aminotransferase [Candidatus Micrarchaeota archaeon]|nr:LL-diaminopimelate aminotransferase [Candidatus Micrarchaeota archaeon]
MVKINENYDKLSPNYLFVEIAKRTKAFSEKNPGVKVMKLGIGNTTEPLTPFVIRGLHAGVEKLADAKTYTGYGDEQGDARLRKAIADFYSKRGITLAQEEIFISDGAKPDSANIQSIFSKDSVVAVQDPSYPVYVDSNVIGGRTGKSDGTTYRGIVYMPCNEANGFFPSLPGEKVDLIYICSPNNPTGAVATKAQLKDFIDYAKKNKAVIVFDAAYHPFISDPSLPRSIYEVEGSKECAIEINSFSKSSGFTGVRLGWTVVPKALVVEGQEAGRVNSIWNRRQTTMFNGASNVAQEGGLAAISDQGIKENQVIISGYMANARAIKECLVAKGLVVFGGENAPYLWIKTPSGMGSWEFFDKMLNEAHVVVTPGSGFGPAGEGYIRISAFGHKNDIQEAVESIRTKLSL